MTATIQKRRARRRQAALTSDPFLEVSESVALLEQAQEASQREIRDLAETTNKQISDVLNIVKEQGIQTGSRLEQLSVQFSLSQRTNWPLLISILVLITILLGAAYRISDLQTKVTLSPIASETAVSSKERIGFREELNSGRSEREAIKADIKVINSTLKEVETQFKAADQSSNVHFAEQQRMNNIMFQLAQGAGGKDHPVQYPLNPYFFPGIADHGEKPAAESKSP